MKSADISATAAGDGRRARGQHCRPSFAAYVKADIAKWKRVIETANIPESDVAGHRRPLPERRGPDEFRHARRSDAETCRAAWPLHRRACLQPCGQHGGHGAAPGAWAQATLPARSRDRAGRGRRRDDVTARMIAQKLPTNGASRSTSTTFRAAPGTSASAAAARRRRTATPSCLPPATFTRQPEPVQQAALRPVQDFAPITLVASGPHVLTVHPSVPANQRGNSSRS